MQIVAPAGNISALRAAVNSGADAVYLGLPRFGARAKADNFSRETLAEAVRFAHVFGTKVFITLNTLIKDGEMSDALDDAKFAYDCGVDAAIVQDIRFIERLRQKLPDFTLHASTQMGVHNADGAKALLDMGLSRAVLSRETLIDDIKEIKNTGIDIEFFVQGALCVCFSGNCYFSSLASSYSGNRGKCMQLCRKKYELNGSVGYYLSAKDICLYDKLSLLSELGVNAIKIEGRMRSEQYVAQAVRVYKSNMPTEQAIGALKSVYNRGDYCSAYLDENPQFNVIYSKSQANIGISVGKVDSVKGNSVFVRGFNPHNDDGFKVMRNRQEIGGGTVKNGVISADCKCRVGDELRRTYDGALASELKNIKRTIPVSVRIRLREGEKPSVVMSADGIELQTVGSFLPQAAKSSALSVDDVLRIFNKTAEYPFAPEIYCDLADKLFMPISALNELRRACYENMYNALASRLPVRSEQKKYALSYNKFSGSGVILQVSSLSCVTPEIQSKIDYIALSPRDYADVANIPHDGVKKPILLTLPVVMRGDERDIIKKAINSDFVYGVISNNLYSLKLTDKPILLGTGHNIIGHTDLPHITSFESDKIDDDSWTYVFGYAPVMTLCHCPYGKCVNCAGFDELKDEDGRVFKLRRYKLKHCYWQLLNCVAHNLITGMPKIGKNRFYDCTELSSSEIVKILDGRIEGNYTRGNINKGLK